MQDYPSPLVYEQKVITEVRKNNYYLEIITLSDERIDHFSEVVNKHFARIRSLEILHAVSKVLSATKVYGVVRNVQKWFSGLISSLKIGKWGKPQKMIRYMRGLEY